MNTRIVFVENQTQSSSSVRRFCSKQSMKLDVVHSWDDAHRHIQKEGAAIVLVGVHEEYRSGEIKRLLEVFPDICVMVLVRQQNLDVAIQALDEGALDYFVRPILDWRRFAHKINMAQDLWNKTMELKKLREEHLERQKLRDMTIFENLKGSSEGLFSVMEQIKDIADVPFSTLIYGESGVGKELVARALHDTSSRRGEPFVAINCSAISPEIFESELFGHEKGAFTGAQSKREGICSSVGNGTLFLDEIGDLPKRLQPKLLRLLEQREFRPVGSNRIQKFTARVVAATHVDLEKATSDGRFRHDLYYRIAVQEIFIPPLRQRKSDIHLLSLYFIRKFNEICSRSVQGISTQARDALESYSWSRNNVRELEREIQRAMIRVQDGDEIDTSHLFWYRGQRYNASEYEELMNNIHQRESISSHIQGSERSLSEKANVSTDQARLSSNEHAMEDKPPIKSSINENNIDDKNLDAKNIDVNNIDENNIDDNTASEELPEWIELDYKRAMEANKIEFLEIYLNYHLQRNNQSKTATAQAIGIQAPNLHRLIRQIKSE